MGIKSRGCFWAEPHDPTDPKCFTLANSCANTYIKCNDCVKVQGKYTEYKEKGEA